MLRKEFEEMCDNMSYEQQKEMLRKMKNNDYQQYDDSCNVIEVLVDSVAACAETIGRMIFKPKH
jgi:hypothetical protein